VRLHKLFSDRAREMSRDRSRGQPGTLEIGPVEPRELNAGLTALPAASGGSGIIGFPVFMVRRCCFSPWGVAFQRTTAVDVWNSPERLTPRPGIQIRSNRRRFSGCAALDDTDNYCRQYDEVKERNHWYQEKPNCVHISTSSSIFGRPAFAVKNF
jgi:hypothetical protein